MSKKRSIVKLCIVAVLTLIGLFLTFFSFVIPTTNTTFKGFFNAINYGYDVNGGVLAVYKPYDESLSGYDLENKVTTTVAKLNSSLGGLGFNFTKQGDNVRVEISTVSYNELTTKLNTYNVDVLSLLGTEEGVIFSSKSNTEEAKTDENRVDGQYLDYCTYKYVNTSWCVEMTFTEEGKTKFKELTKSIAEGSDNKLYIHVNGQLYNTGGFEIDNAISSLLLTATNQQAAEALSIQFSALAKPVLLSQVVCDVVTAGLNSSTGFFFGNTANLLMFALGAIVLATMVVLCVKYRVLGALASVSLLIFISIYSFLLQSIPLVMMDVNGILGVLATLAILIAGIVNIFERIKKEYSAGKKIPNSVTSGFKKNVLPTLDKYVFVLIMCAILYIVGFAPLKALAVNLFIGLFVNYFILYVVLRGLCNIYLPINSTKKSLYNLKREGIKNEV